MLFWKFIWKNYKIIFKHVRTLRGKLFASTCFSLCAVSKYAWMLRYCASYRPASAQPRPAPIAAGATAET
jgi:hypothetical protein